MIPQIDKLKSLGQELGVTFLSFLLSGRDPFPPGISVNLIWLYLESTSVGPSSSDPSIDTDYDRDLGHARNYV